MSTDINALELAYNNKSRSFITVNENKEYIVFDKIDNKEVYNFGDATKMITLLSAYAELNYKF